MTLTAPTGIKFGAETGITFPGAAGEPVITGISADSTVLSFLPAPGTDTAAAVSGLELTFAPGVPVDTLVTTTKITTPTDYGDSGGFLQHHSRGESTGHRHRPGIPLPSAAVW